ncbi:MULTISPECIES: antiterminator Q family protein [Vibrio]|uniref:antiterminator Q family protein n=1 Tax=Vibrio TaxID=662 RepID=UPI0015587377|nr:MULTISPECIES: antiterminator Q family protein [Vibrio]MBL4288366.1 hypothetical protein [Vibrio fluvialis]MBL4292737.1 hypothetical protein [Vibrio fluvialis]
MGNLKLNKHDGRHTGSSNFFDLSGVRELLHAWGRWSNDNTGCDWYRDTPYLSSVTPKPSRNHISITDERAGIVDKAIANLLQERNSQAMSFLVLYYAYGLNKSEIARLAAKADRKKCSEGKVRNAIQLAEFFLAGVFSQQGLLKQLSSKAA